MYEIKMTTWIVAGFGVLTFAPLLIAQLMMILKPNGKFAKDLIIGKGEEWRDSTHFKYSLAFAWADWLVIFPLLALGTFGVFTGLAWGFYLWIALGVISIYFSIIYWVLEKEFVYPKTGWFAYYTYFWGFFLYWGVAAITYSLLQLL